MTGVYCELYAWNGVLSGVRFGAVQPDATKGRYQPMAPNYTVTVGQYRYYSAVQETTRVFTPGLQPVVAASGFKTSDANMNISISCQIVGQLTNAN